MLFPLLPSMLIASGLGRIILSSVVCVPAPYFPTLSHKRKSLREKLFNIKCVSVFSISSYFSGIHELHIQIMNSSAFCIRIR